MLTQCTVAIGPVTRTRTAAGGASSTHAPPPPPPNTSVLATKSSSSSSSSSTTTSPRTLSAVASGRTTASAETVPSRDSSDSARCERRHVVADALIDARYGRVSRPSDGEGIAIVGVAVVVAASSRGRGSVDAGRGDDSVVVREKLFASSRPTRARTVPTRRRLRRVRPRVSASARSFDERCSRGHPLTSPVALGRVRTSAREVATRRFVLRKYNGRPARGAIWVSSRRGVYDTLVTQF
eukprot:30920-Pelagococcus_subviridis.AAC.36